MSETNIDWKRGPAQGGGGTAGKRDGCPIWRDGDLLLIVVNTIGGGSVFLCRVNSDGDEDWDQLSFVDPETGDEYFGYYEDDIDWFAVIDETNLPPKNNE